jgi:tRNA-(ms[2]io[6]A)-hydroxylase
MPAPDGKRRLPLAPRVEVGAEGDEDRPPWHWAAIGAVGVFVFWLPLAIGVNALLGGRSGAAVVALHAAAFVLASAGSGFLVGRFGGKAGRREAAAGGLGAAGVAWLLAAAQGLHASVGTLVTWALLLAAMGALGGGAAWLGGARGVRGRTPR